MIDSIKATV